MPEGEPNSGASGTPAGQQQQNAGSASGTQTPAQQQTPSNQNPNPEPQGQPQQAQQPSQPQLTLDQALNELEKVRKEAAKNRVDGNRLKELEDAQRKADLEKLSETERLRKEFADLQTAQADAQRKSQERVIRAEVRAHAVTVGIPPELAGRLIDYAEIEYDSDGEPQNIGKLLEKLVKQYPMLAANANTQQQRLQPTSVGQTPANPPRSGSTSGAITHEYIASLTPRQYSELTEERRTEIKNWLVQNPRTAQK